MGDHVLGIIVGDGRKIPEGLLLTEIISESKSWHLDGQLLEFRLGEVVRALDILYFVIVSVCVLLWSVNILGRCSSGLWI